jgi:O-antigen ligase
MADSPTHPPRRHWAPTLHTWALLCAVVLVPLVNAPDHLVWFDITPKIAVMLLMVGIAIASIPSELLDSLTPKYCKFLPCGMIAVAALSTAFSYAPFLSLGGSSWRRVGLPAEFSLAAFMLLLTATAGDNSRRVIWCLRASCVALIAASVTVLLQVLGIWTNSGFESLRETVRPGGVLGSGAAYGCYATSPIFLCATLWFIDNRTPWRYLAFTAGTVGFAALVFSGTRAGLLGVLVGALLSLILLKRRAAGIGVGVLAGLALTFGLALTTGAPLLRRLEQVRLDVWGATRLDVWRDSLKLFSSLPTFGYGLESFPRIYPKVRSQQTALDWPNTFHESSHNYLLEVALSRGAPGLVVVLGVSVSAFLALMRLSPEKKHLYSFCLAGHIASLTTCMFFTPQLPTLLYLYLPVCLIWASCRDDNHPFHATGRPLPAARRSRSGRLQIALIRGAGLALVVYSVCLVMWDSRVYEAKVLLDSGKIDNALKAFARARQIAPPGVTAEAWLSRELLAKVNSASSHSLDQQMYCSLRVAIRREEDFGDASVLLAVKMIADGKLDEASIVLGRTILEFPNWELPKNILRKVQASNRSGKE